jgi:hypothetical protein
MAGGVINENLHVNEVHLSGVVERLDLRLVLGDHSGRWRRERYREYRG